MSTSRSLYRQARDLLCRFALVFILVPMTSTTIISWAPTLSNGSEHVANSPRAVVEEFLKGRKAIVRGHLILNCEVWNSAPESSRPANSGTMIWFDGDKLRGDHRWAAMNWHRNGGVGENLDIACFNGLKQGVVFSYSNRRAPVQNGVLAVTLADTSRSTLVGHPVPSPRWFGCLPIDSRNMVHYQPTEVFDPLGSISRAELSSEPGEDGLAVLAWSDKRPSGMRCEYKAWFAPSKGFSIVRIQSTFDNGAGITFVDDTISQVELHARSNLWFPTAWVYRRTENGKLTRQERAVVQPASLNAELDATAFSLKGVSILKAGTPVAWHSSDRPAGTGRFIWDGDQIVWSKRALGLPEAK